MRRTAMLMVGVVLAIGASAQAGIWTYNFDGFNTSTSAADSWGFLPQVTTTEGWAIGGSSTTTLQRGMVVADPDGSGKVITSNWLSGHYVNARVGYATGGQGNIATITDMATAPKVTYTWDVMSGDYASGSGRGYQWDVGVYEGTTMRFSLGNNSAGNPGLSGASPWLFYTPVGTINLAKPLVFNEWVVVKLELDLATNLGTVYFNGVADANLTNVNLVGGSGVNLRNLNNIWFDEHGGGTRALSVSTNVPEPATMSLLALGGIGVLLRRRRK